MTESLPVEDRFLQHAAQISLCLSPLELIEESLGSHESCLGPDGQICVVTGMHTGRSAKDKWIVDRPDLKFVGFGEAGRAIDPTKFERLCDLVSGYLTGRAVYVQDFIAGPIKGRVITDSPSHALFTTHMFKATKEPHLEVDLTIVAVPGCRANPTSLNISSSTFIACDLVDGLFLIGGTSYAGEVKKSVFTYLSYILPQQNVLPMHSSVTTAKDGTNTAVFFGLSGTGKTTLSADPKRKLVGDDEHGWGSDGVFNFESGCYAKVIKLSQKNEPMIWGACHSFGTLLENVEMSETRVLDFDSSKITENTRAAYPLSLIKNSHEVGYLASHPKNIIMLTCDAYGVLPSVAKLTPHGAAYHFLSGYTAKVAGTEKGVTEPQATFSACFGAPFMPMVVSTYADMLVKRIEEFKPDVWLVNTGWVGGGYGVGSRIDLPTTREIINMIVDGTMAQKEFYHNDYFNLDVPKDVPHTTPMSAWNNKNGYDMASGELIEKFNDNIERFTLSEEILNAGMPRHE